MEDEPFAEDASSSTSRKRKGSPDNLVDIPVPVPSYIHPPPGSVAGVPGSPAPPPLKKIRVSSGPHVPSSSTGLSIQNLPEAVIQSILTYLDLKSLAKAIRVSRKFRALLDPRCNIAIDPGKTTNVRLVLQDTIWSLARQTYLPSLPDPPPNTTNYNLISLVLGSSCQFCGRAVSTENVTYDEVQTIWPFQIRACLACLKPRIVKDLDVMLSNAGPLRPGLSFAMFTPEMHYVWLHTFQETPAADSTNCTKFRYRPQVEQLQREAVEAGDLDPGDMKEWYDRLTGRGKQLQLTAAQFERWENQGGVTHVRQLSGSAHAADAVPPVGRPSFLPSRPPVPVPSIEPGFQLSSIPTPVSMISAPLMPLQTYGLPPGLQLPNRPPDLDTLSSGSQRRTVKPPLPQAERQQIKSEKRREIQRRCWRLDPPILPEVLEQLPAYDAALSLAVPLNDNAWTTLRPRLEEQARKQRLEYEARSSIRTAPVPGQFNAPARTDEYVLAQAEKRVKDVLYDIAMEYMKQVYAFGSAVVYHTAPQFAADVLLNTRQEFINLQARIRSLRASKNPKRPSYPLEEELQIDHMRYIFIECIKKRTEGIRKELFMCNDCAPSATRYFAFESIIQHYAQQHTEAFSRGPTKVYWKSPWPARPPFKPTPERVDTPDPSITLTPTMPYQPLSVTSPESTTTATLPVQGLYSPDTMSLISNDTRVTSITNPQALAQEMYHFQRDVLALELVRAWDMVCQVQHMPSTLQVALTLLMAVPAFEKRCTNRASIELFKDCLHRNDQLMELRNISRLRCGECVQRPDEHAEKYALQELTNHFEREHLSRSRKSSKLVWHEDLLDLPSPQLIKIFLQDNGLPHSLLHPLQGAYLKAIPRYAGEAIPIPAPATPLNNHEGLEHKMEYLHGPVNQRRHDVASLTPGLMLQHSNPVKEYVPTISFPGVRALPSDRGLTTSTGIVLPSAQCRVEEINVNHEPRSILQNTVSSAGQGEDMARSETIGSRASLKQKIRPSQAGVASDTATDFLGTIESNLDVEMRSVSQEHSMNVRTSRPTSRTEYPRLPLHEPQRESSTGSFSNGMSGATSRSQARNLNENYAADGSTSSMRAYHRQATDLTEPVRYAPSHSTEANPAQVIEFDKNGNPVPRTDFIYVNSPPRHYQGAHESIGHHLEPYYQHDGRAYPQDRYEATDPNPEIEAVYETVYQDRYGRHYVERPAVQRQYIEVDTSHIQPRPEFMRRTAAARNYPREQHSSSARRE